MKTYRRIPDVVQAEQFKIDERPWPAFVIDETYIKTDREGTMVARVTDYVLMTNDGKQIIKNGDWIIHRGRERFALSDAVFKARYEPVLDEEESDGSESTSDSVEDGVEEDRPDRAEKP